MKIPLKKVRTLDLDQAYQNGRPSHISAASGLVVDEKNFYVIADDELSLAIFPRDGSLGKLTPLFSGTLPLKHKERKKNSILSL